MDFLVPRSGSSSRISVLGFPSSPDADADARTDRYHVHAPPYDTMPMPMPHQLLSPRLASLLLLLSHFSHRTLLRFASFPYYSSFFCPARIAWFILHITYNNTYDIRHTQYIHNPHPTHPHARTSRDRETDSGRRGRWLPPPPPTTMMMMICSSVEYSTPIYLSIYSILLAS